MRCNLTAQRFPCAVFAERTALENGGKSRAERTSTRTRTRHVRLRMRSIFKMPFVRPPPRPRPWSGA